MNPCADIEITLHRQDQQNYAVDFRFSDSDPNNQTEVRLAAGQAALARFDLEQLRELAALGEMPEYGRALTEGLFADERLRTAFAQARAAAEQTRAALRLRLNIHPGALELFALRWETLSDPQSGLSLATDQNVYFSRYLSSQDWRPVRLRAKGELKALAVIAAPAGLDAYKLASVEKSVETATIAAGLDGIALTVLDKATLPALSQALSAAEFDLVYLVAHGSFVNGEAYLWLENETGGVDRVPGAELVTRVRQLEKRPRLVVLVSCQSAGKGEGEVLAALGPRLAEAGVPAVLAMQANVQMETIAKFMPLFLSELQKDGQIDRALSVARGVVRTQPDWWAPVLFMRLKSGRLWYVPGFGGPRGDFPKWPSLLRGIQSGRCTPILGPGLTEALFGAQEELTRQWAEELEFPLAANERESLPHVAQYRSVDQSRFTAEDEWLAHLRAAIRSHIELPAELQAPQAPLGKLLTAAREQSLARNTFEPHAILARLPVRIFITTNPDELLEEALRAAGKQPTTLVCPWREFSEQSDPGQLAAEEDLDPTPEAPLVYHLFGLLSQPESLVLTEDDLFEFLIGITRHMKRIPDPVGRALADSALLLLGFQTSAWSFRVLMKALLAKEGSSLLRRHAHIAAQIEPDESHLLDPARARRYLETYFARGASEVEITVYWGTPHEFMQELASRLTP
jgi:hypothetical protein